MFKPIENHQYCVIDFWYDNDTFIYYISDLTAMRNYYIRENVYQKYSYLFK